MRIFDPRTTRHDFDQLVNRRRQGMQLLGQGVPQAEVARRCGVSSATTNRWAKRQAA